MPDKINQLYLLPETIQNLKNLDFKCQRCSNCCRHDEGFVFLTKQNVDAIAEHLKMSKKQFIDECCRVVDENGTKYLCLKEKQNYDCIFWSDGCIIYEVRPTQCMTFPYWPFLVNDKKLQNEEKKRCKGLGKKGDHNMEYKIEMYLMEQNSDYYVVNDEEK